jgi:hypothetical protein
VEPTTIRADFTAHRDTYDRAGRCAMLDELAVGLGGRVKLFA